MLCSHLVNETRTQCNLHLVVRILRPSDSVTQFASYVVPAPIAVSIGD